MAGTGTFACQFRTPLMALAENFELRPTRPDDIIHGLLEEDGLPTADLATPDVRLYEATVDGTLVGIGGFEQYGTNALLRSVVVRPGMRGRGHGTRICLELEDRAAEAVCTAIYLLTNDAGGFFEQLGYERVDRSSVPDAIRSTREFSELCPSTADCMVKTV